MKVDTEDLIGSSEVATLLGVSRAAVSNYKTRHPGFPAPVLTVSGSIDVYSRSEIVAWVAGRMSPELLVALAESHQRLADALRQASV